MKLIFIHGWSVTSTETYGDLPKVLQSTAPESLNLKIENIYLGEYISFHDEVTLEDIARAFEVARKDKLGKERFACITHSTGAPVIRLWIDLYFKDKLLKDMLSNTPISHLIMLAPANHGSSLAILGKSKLSRMDAWFKGVEVGTKVLDWLQLGSTYQWNLNNSWLNYVYNENKFFAFVLSGEKIDESFYDFINSYLVEKGSDGVVRLCGANMNYKTITLKQKSGTNILELQGSIKNSPKSAFEVIPKASHSGTKYGIMASVKENRKVKPIVNSILEALSVKDTQDYNQVVENMTKRTEVVQKNKQRYIMFVISVKDNYNNKIHDYDMILLAGKEYEPNKLPKGFFVDKQKNDMSGNIVYYLNYDKLKDIKDGCLGIRIVARPDKGFSRYAVAEFRSDEIDLEEFLIANQTLMVEVVLERLIARNTFVLDGVSDKAIEFDGRVAYDEFV